MVHFWEGCSVFIHMLDLVLYRCSCIIQTIQFLFYIVYHGLTDLIFASVVIQYFSNGYSGKSGCTFVYLQLKNPLTGSSAQSQAALNSVQILLYSCSASWLTFCTISPFVTLSGTTRLSSTRSSAALFVL